MLVLVLLEYQWEQSLDNINWTDIPNATQDAFDPVVITSTTYFRRKVRIGVINPVVNYQYDYKNSYALIFHSYYIHRSKRVQMAICAEGESYIYQAADAGVGSFYSWDFGPYASPANCCLESGHIPLLLALLQIAYPLIRLRF